MTSGGSNARLVGVAGSRGKLSTPALLLDLDAFEKNLEAMRQSIKQLGLAYRPHVKAHKSPEIGRRQIAAGAIGLSCATLDEAEAMARGGCNGLLLTSPVATPPHIARLVELAGSVADLSAVVDNAQNIRELGIAFAKSGLSLNVLIDYNVGQNRTGANSEEEAITLARLVDNAAGLTFKGIQAYYGHYQHLKTYEERKLATATQQDRTRSLVQALSTEGLAVEIVSGGGTGTFHVDGSRGVHTEIQPGTYAFMDLQYAAVEIVTGKPNPFEHALFVQTSVVSINQPGMVVVNGGWKAFSTESGLPAVCSGAPTSSTYKFMGDEHGGLTLPANAEKPALGSTIEFIPCHCDPTTNLFRRFHCVRGDTLVDIWAIEANGY